MFRASNGVPTDDAIQPHALQVWEDVQPRRPLVRHVCGRAKARFRYLQPRADELADSRRRPRQQKALLMVALRLDQLVPDLFPSPAVEGLATALAVLPAEDDFSLASLSRSQTSARSTPRADRCNVSIPEASWRNEAAPQSL